MRPPSDTFSADVAILTITISSRARGLGALFGIAS